MSKDTAIIIIITRWRHDQQQQHHINSRLHTLYSSENCSTAGSMLTYNQHRPRCLSLILSVTTDLLQTWHNKWLIVRHSKPCPATHCTACLQRWLLQSFQFMERNYLQSTTTSAANRKNKIQTLMNTISHKSQTTTLWVFVNFRLTTKTQLEGHSVERSYLRQRCFNGSLAQWIKPC